MIHLGWSQLRLLRERMVAVKGRVDLVGGAVLSGPLHYSILFSRSAAIIAGGGEVRDEPATG